MNPDLVVSLTTETLKTSLLLAAPMLGFGLMAGLSISIFQSVTQIQEMTLTFIPKILSVVFALLIFFPWMMNIMIDFTTTLYQNFPTYIGK